MLLHIIARGKIGRTPEAELVERYLKRIAWPTKITELPDRGGIIPPAPSASVTVPLDERGTILSSTDFAKKLEAWRDGGKREVQFLIGAANGHEEGLRGSADLMLSFGLATWVFSRSSRPNLSRRFPPARSAAEDANQWRASLGEISKKRRRCSRFSLRPKPSVPSVWSRPSNHGVSWSGTAFI